LVKCVCCGWRGKSFLDYGAPLRKNVKCPVCGSKERQRATFILLKKILPLKRKISVLHIAPEDSIRKLFLDYSNINYISIDLNPSRAMLKEDLMHLSFKNNLFDLVICSHVLEHILDDLAALEEIFRVMKKNSYAIIQVPLFNRRKTLEGVNYSFEKKINLFGQKDHLRAYGRDFENILKSAGFLVFKINILDILNKKMIEEYRLIQNVKGTPLEGRNQESIFILKKE